MHNQTTPRTQLITVVQSYISIHILHIPPTCLIISRLFVQIELYRLEHIILKAQRRWRRWVNSQIFALRFADSNEMPMQILKFLHHMICEDYLHERTPSKQAIQFPLSLSNFSWEFENGKPVEPLRRLSGLVPWGPTATLHLDSHHMSRKSVNAKASYIHIKRQRIILRIAWTRSHEFTGSPTHAWFSSISAASYSMHLWNLVLGNFSV